MQLRIKVGADEFEASGNDDATIKELYREWLHLITNGHPEAYVPKPGPEPAKDWSDPRNAPPAFEFERHVFQADDTLTVMCRICGGGELHAVHQTDKIFTPKESNEAARRVNPQRPTEPHSYEPHPHVPLCAKCGGGELNAIHVFSIPLTSEVNPAQELPPDAHPAD